MFVPEFKHVAAQVTTVLTQYRCMILFITWEAMNSLSDTEVISQKWEVYSFRPASTPVSLLLIQYVTAQSFLSCSLERHCKPLRTATTRQANMP